MIKCCIFDFDGTLVDSMKYWSIAPLEYIRSFNVAVPDDFSNVFLSYSFQEDAKIIKENYLKDKSIEEIMNGINKIMENYYLTSVKLKLGIKELIEMLKNKNIKLSIATSTDSKLLNKVCEKLDIKRYFDFLISTADIKISKRFPDVYMMCSNHFNIPYNESMIFEDLPYGLIATKDLGFKRIAVYDEYSKMHEKSLKENSDYYFELLNKENIEPLL